MVPHQSEQQPDQKQEDHESAFDSLETTETRLTSALPPDSPNGLPQEAANNSLQVRQLSSMQEMANKSSAVEMQRQRHESINASLIGQNSGGGRRSFAPPSIELIASSDQSSTTSPVQRKQRPGQKVMQLISVMIEPKTNSAPSNPPNTSTNSATESMDVDPAPPTRMHIAVLRVKGRPKNAYGNTPGDHSTAFGVHQDGFENALQGKSLETAFEYCRTEYGEILELGMNESIINNRKEEYKDYQTSIPNKLDTITGLIHEEIRPETDQRIALILQELIGDLLSMRDLTRLNSFNTKAAIEGKTGLGKGESHRLGYLRYQEANLKSKDQFDYPIEKKQAINAILDLFDAGAIRIGIVQTRQFWPKFLGGIPSDILVPDLVELLCQRHSQSISRAYPNVWRILDESEVQNQFRLYLRHNIQVGTYNERELLLDKSDQYQRELDELNQPRMLSLGDSEKFRRKMDRQDAARKEELIPLLEEVISHITEIEDTRNAMGFPAEQSFPRRRKRAAQPDPSISIFDDSRIKLDKKGKIPEPTPLWQNPTGEVDTDRDKYAAGSKRLASAGEAVQITLNEGDKINSVQFGGRPKSPWPGTMGAHTTAWTVHERIVKAKILSKSLDEAKTKVDLLLTEASNLRTQRQALFQREYDDHMVDNMDTSFAEAITIRDDQTSFLAYPVFQLQKYIGAYFQFLNNIWGMSANAVGTDGKGEGAACNNIEKLLSGRSSDLETFLYVHEHELLYYVYKTLDLVKYQRANSREEQMNKLTEDHWEFILQAYPELNGLKGKAKPSPFTKPSRQNNWLRRQAPQETGPSSPNKKKRNIRDIGTPPPYPVHSSPEAAPPSSNPLSVSVEENSDLLPLTIDLSMMPIPPGFSLDTGRINDDSALPPPGKYWHGSNPPQKHKKRRMTEPVISIPKLNTNPPPPAPMDLDSSPYHAPSGFTYSPHVGGGGVGMGYNSSAGGMDSPHKAPMVFPPQIPLFNILPNLSRVSGCTLIQWNIAPTKGVYNVRISDFVIFDNAGNPIGFFDINSGPRPL